MEIIFEGLSRQVYTHRHQINPHWNEESPYIPLTWDSATKATGIIYNLSLSGNFNISFVFDDIELRNWLEKYIEEKPEEGLALVQEMQTKAILKLVQKNSEPISE